MPRRQYWLVRLTFQLQSHPFFINLAHGATNSLIFAEYTLASFGSAPPPSDSVFSPVRLVAFICLTGVLVLHGLHIPAGIRLQNLLGFTKIGIPLILVGTGFMALTGNLQEGVPRAGNFDSWEEIWAGSTTGGSALCTCLYSVSLYLLQVLYSKDTQTSRLYFASKGSAMRITPLLKSIILLELFGLRVHSPSLSPPFSTCSVILRITPQ